MKEINLKALRRKREMTQQQVADKAEISRSYYAMLENDTKKHRFMPTVEVTKKIAEVLDFDWGRYYMQHNK